MTSLAHTQMPSGETAAADMAPGFALYVHWPFCRAKCPYCDFNSHVRAQVDHDRWARALVREMEHVAGRVRGRRLRSIFFGGGTPSLMDARAVEAVIAHADRHWPFEDGIEITLEANPTSAEAQKFRDFAQAGVNRLSLGVQALDDADLAFLGREHDVATALQAFDLARRAFARCSFDLIYARPNQTADQWLRELQRAIDLAVDHISLYQLTIERGTPFHAHAREGRLKPMPEPLQAEIFCATRELLEQVGMPAYEVSNHARPGSQCRHNLVYWRSGEWASIGPGAHGRLDLAAGRVGTSSERVPERWLRAVERDGHAQFADEPIGSDAVLLEYLMMGLRLTEGVSLARLERLAGRPVSGVLDTRRVRAFEREGWLRACDGRIAATTEGMLRLDGLLRDLLS